MRVEAADGEKDRTRGKLPTWRIGLTGGLVGMLCCVGPTLLAIFGVVSAGTAFAMATDLYEGYGWWFRGAGLLVLAGMVWLALRRRAMCNVAGLRQVRFRIIGILAVAVVTYLILYVVTTRLGESV
ncbi:MAG: hypothetical protein L0Z49_07495 [Actinobacteria bacterium]|nr:hypothetical protein [Actinomycetota bacterium]MCI0544278.1 hypothetical protein [Actinomycetota bacterium]